MKIIAKIHLKQSSEGGRENPVYSGYRPTFRWEGNRISDCVITILEGHSIKSGEQGKVEIKILHPKKIEGITTFDRFSITEGSREVATGSIIEIQLHPFKIGDLVLY